MTARGRPCGPCRTLGPLGGAVSRRREPRGGARPRCAGPRGRRPGRAGRRGLDAPHATPRAATPIVSAPGRSGASLAPSSARTATGGNGDGRSARFALDDLGHRRRRDGRGHHPAVLMAGVHLGRGRRDPAGGARPAEPGRRAGRRRQGHRRLPVPDRHDAAVRAGPAGRAVRLAGGTRGRWRRVRPRACSPWSSPSARS